MIQKVKKLLVSLVTFVIVFVVGIVSMRPEVVIAASLSGADKLIALGMPDTLARYFASSLVSVNSSGNLILAVASGKKLSITVAGTEQASVSSAGVVTGAGGLVATAGGVTATAGNITATNGEFVASTSGKTLSLQEATAGAKCMGLVTSNGTTAVTVSTTCATTGSRIFFSALDDQTGTTTAHCWTTNIVNGVSFDFDCDGASNASFHWMIVHEAP